MICVVLGAARSEHLPFRLDPVWTSSGNSPALFARLCMFHGILRSPPLVPNMLCTEFSVIYPARQSVAKWILFRNHFIETKNKKHLRPQVDTRKSFRSDLFSVLHRKICWLCCQHCSYRGGTTQNSWHNGSPETLCARLFPNYTQKIPNE